MYQEDAREWTKRTPVLAPLSGQSQNDFVMFLFFWLPPPFQIFGDFFTLSAPRRRMIQEIIETIWRQKWVCEGDAERRRGCVRRKENGE